METQVNVGDQNVQQIEQNPVSQTSQAVEKPKANYLIISTIVLLVVLLGLGYFYLKNFKSQKATSSLSQISEDGNVKNNQYVFLPKDTSTISQIPSTAYIRLNEDKIESVDLASGAVRTVASIGPSLVNTNKGSSDVQNGTYGNYSGIAWSGVELVPIRNIGKILAVYSRGTRLSDQYRALGIVMYDFASGEADVLYQTRTFPTVNELKPVNYHVFYDEDTNQVFVLSSFGQFNDRENFPAISGFAVYRLSTNKTLDPYGLTFNSLPKPISAELQFMGKNNDNKLIISDPQSDYFTYFQSSITDTFDKAISKIKTQKAYLVDTNNPSIQETTITPKDLSLIDNKYYILTISETTQCGELSIRTSSLPFNIETNVVEKPKGDYFYQLVGYSTKLKSFFFHLDGKATNELYQVRQAKNQQELDNACDKYFQAQTINNSYMVFSIEDKSSKLISKNDLIKQYIPEMDTQFDVDTLVPEKLQ